MFLKLGINLILAAQKAKPTYEIFKYTLVITSCYQNINFSENVKKNPNL